MSRFWDFLSKEHKALFDEKGISDFRQNIARRYMTVGKNDTEGWIQTQYDLLRDEGIVVNEDPCIGNPIFATKHGKIITQDSIHSARELATIEKYVPLKEIKAVSEIGAGYGRTAYTILKKYPKIDYTIIDIEPARSISKEYLLKTLVNPNLNYAVFPPRADLYIAISVFSELTRDDVIDYIDTFYDGSYVYIRDWKDYHNVADGISIDMNHYMIPKEWEILLFRDDRILPQFFEAIYKVKK